MDPAEFYQAKLDHETDSWDLFEALASDNPPVVIDARSSEAHAEEHIPGAISLPHRTIDAASTASLDRGRIHVTYCDGIGCNASTKGALKLAALGFTVKELIGGLDWWHRDGYQTHGTRARKGTPVRCSC